MNTPKTKAIRINVYLTSEDKKILNGLKYQYQLSYSTIANILADYICNMTDENLGQSYIYTNDVNSTKTSIKPRNLKIFSDRKTILYTNVIKLWTRNDLVKKGILENNKKLSKLQKLVIKAFKETKDPNWDGNEFRRKMTRMFRQNPDYFKKILDNE